MTMRVGCARKSVVGARAYDATGPRECQLGAGMDDARGGRAPDGAAAVGPRGDVSPAPRGGGTAPQRDARAEHLLARAPSPAARGLPRREGPARGCPRLRVRQ